MSPASRHLVISLAALVAAWSLPAQAEMVASAGYGEVSVDEPTEYPDEGATSYAAIHRDFLDPIDRAQSLALRITTAIANEFGAHG